MLSLKAVSYFYNKDKVVLKNINVVLPNNGFVLIKGESGSGKTTLINLIAGLDSPKEGSIFFNSRKIDQSFLDTYRRHCCSIVFQELNLIRGLTVKENLVLGFETSGFPYNESEVKEYFKKLNLNFEELINRHSSELSGGEQQRVAIIRALVKKPKILILDEPTSALDYDNGTDVLDSLKELSKDMLVIVASHDLLRLEKYSDIEIRLSHGEVTIEKNYLSNCQSVLDDDHAKKSNLSLKSIFGFVFSLRNKNKTRLVGTLITNVLLIVLASLSNSFLFFNTNKALLSGQNTLNSPFYQISLREYSFNKPLNLRLFTEDQENYLLDKGYLRFSRIGTSLTSYERGKDYSNDLKYRFFDNKQIYEAVEIDEKFNLPFDKTSTLCSQHIPTNYNEIGITSSLAEYLIDYSCLTSFSSNGEIITRYKNYDDLLTFGRCYGFKITCIFKNPDYDYFSKFDFKDYSNLNKCAGFSIAKCVFLKKGYAKYRMEKTIEDVRINGDYSPYKNAQYLLASDGCSTSTAIKNLSEFTYYDNGVRVELEVGNLFTTIIYPAQYIKGDSFTINIVLVFLILLLISIQILNYSLFSSIGKTDEISIGILKCIGATKREIREIFVFGFLFLFLVELLLFFPTYGLSLLVINLVISFEVKCFYLFCWHTVILMFFSLIISYFGLCAGAKYSIVSKPICIVRNSL